MNKSYKFLIATILFISMFLISCGRDSKQSQSNLTVPIDEEIKYARSLYGENAELLLKGDLTSGGKTEIFAGVVKQKVNSNIYWLEKGGILEKNKDSWKTILNIENKLSSSKGELISQENAKYGYIIRINDSKKPVSFTVTIANEYGKGASDEALVKWNSKNDAYEIAIDGDSSIQ